MKRLWSLALALLMALTLVLSGCGGNSGEQTGGQQTSGSPSGGESSSGGAGDADRMLYVVTSSDVQNLDPNNDTTQNRLQVKAQIYETLVRFDENGGAATRCCK